MSTRRLRARLDSDSFGTLGRYSPYPAADSRSGAIPPCWIRNMTTREARAVDSSQLDSYLDVRIGRSSVCPSTRMATGLDRNRSASLVTTCWAACVRSAFPVGNDPASALSLIHI